MPPQISKKAVTTKRSARRNDHHESRKNITVEEEDEDIAGTDDADIAEAGDSQSTTQSRAKSSDLGNLMVNMVQAVCSVIDCENSPESYAHRSLARETPCSCYRKCP
jgi:hypothetical protein